MKDTAADCNYRRPTQEVMVGNVGIGGQHPIRIQSMTTTPTRDVKATTEQIMRLSDEGCEIVRVTVQGKAEARACEEIKNTLEKKSYRVPLVADIHFYPPAAMLCADFVDKVRINPGNFLDKRATFKVLEYSDADYQEELLRIEEKFTPLVEKCKLLKRALRIGSNHGSLSDRIMNRYGDSPYGMCESALEYARICRKLDFHNFVFSMKSSNPKVMMEAYRLLVQQMELLGWRYPLHLGVTEAGSGEDGRIKSAVGIGSLLLEGIGDTIRVSLTEDPEKELDPCRRLVAFAKASKKMKVHKPETFEKRSTVHPQKISLHREGSVGLVLKASEESKEIYKDLGFKEEGQTYCKDLSTVDLIQLEEGVGQKFVSSLQNLGVTTFRRPQTLKKASLLSKRRVLERSFFLKEESISSEGEVLLVNEEEEDWKKLLSLDPSLILLHLAKAGRVGKAREFFAFLKSENLQVPVLLNFSYGGLWEDVVIQASAECGALLCDGLGEGVLLEAPYSYQAIRTLSFGILQAARMRTTKTEFISCPSCGRTLFDLQEVTRRIQNRTEHLPGVKIAVMGCIVNGPGEMADADFGYVGSRPGMIDLYVGKTCVEKNIEHSQADDRLVELIKIHGRWVEPEQVLAVKN